jgi:hypothetical protein
MSRFDRTARSRNEAFLNGHLGIVNSVLTILLYDSLPNAFTIVYDLIGMPLVHWVGLNEAAVDARETYMGGKRDAPPAMS